MKMNPTKKKMPAIVELGQLDEVTGGVRQLNGPTQLSIPPTSLQERSVTQLLSAIFRDRPPPSASIFP